MNSQGQIICSIINIDEHVYLFGSTWEKSLIEKKKFQGEFYGVH